MNTRKLKPIPDLDRLDPTERAQLWTDLDNGLSYDRAVRLLGAEHFISIRRHKLFTWWHREKDRRDLNAQLASEHRLEPATYLALLNGQTLPWSDLIHTRVLQAAFALTATADHTPARLLTLQRIANNQFNQNLATDRLHISKRSLRLREKQFAFKSGSDLEHRSFDDILGPPLCHGDEPPTNPQATPTPSFPHLGETTFGGTSSGGTSSASPTLPVPRSSTPDGRSSDCNTSPTTPINTGFQAGGTAPNADSLTASAVFTAPSPRLGHSALNSREPSPSAPKPKSLPSLEERVNDYTLARDQEFRVAMHAANKNGHALRDFQSKMRVCPCGKFLPCPEHGQFPREFFELVPGIHPDYIYILQQKNLPYTDPNLIRAEREKRDRRLAAEKALLSQWPEESARTSMLIEKARSHATRRWRSYTPRPPFTPPPDESWHDECPCGAPLPCDLHPDLGPSVRHLKPSNPEYTALLKQHGIPVYTPTDEERSFTLNAK